MTKSKSLIVDHIKKILDKRIESTIRDIELAKESRDNETKSTAGDKYETGRSMIQFELENKNIQLNKTIQLKNELLQIDIRKKHNWVEIGSIVYTNVDTYFISIGLGKIEFDKQNLYSISLASPLGKALWHKVIGDTIFFQKKEIIIKEIV